MNTVRRAQPASPPDVERTLLAALDEILAPQTPAPLAEAIRHAVLAGGSRFRPRLLFAVAASAGAYDARFAERAAAAVELLHCASLVHDDLPAFDDASTRRGQPTVHRKFGEALAVLAGDALIVGAYETLHTGTARHARGSEAMRVLLRAGGAAEGLCMGQALELDPTAEVDVTSYHRAKTGALFEAAATLGALSASVEPAPWVDVGRELGLLYQAVDDLLDVYGDAALIGKDVGNDARHGRPSVAKPPESGSRLVAEITRDVLGARTTRLRRAVPRGAGPLAAYVEELLAELTKKLGGRRTSATSN